MDQWTGFTDAHIRRLKNTPDQDSVTNYHQDGTRMDGRDYQQSRPQNSRPPSQRGRGRGPTGQDHSHVTDHASINQKQMLSKPKQVRKQQGTNQRQEQMLSNQEQGRRELTNQKTDRTKAPVLSGAVASRTDAKRPVEVQSITRTPDHELNRNKSVHDVEAGKNDGPSVDRKVQDELKKQEAVMGEELGEKEGLSRELSKMEHFQQQQKEIEDENLRKKKLLSRAIADRKKKTQEESKRLVYIQKELSKIEEFLTNDVNILRDKIEEASRHYSEAQKRYQKAEAEFVTAKISLHKASDHKEALTEHLCTIIRENELRISKKLEELVEKLDVDNLAAFEAETDPLKPEAQPRLSSSSVGDTSENVRGTSSAGEASGEAPAPADPTVPPASHTEVQDSPGTTPHQGQGSSTSVTGDDVTAPHSISNETSETLGKDVPGKTERNGQTDSNKNFDDSSSKSLATTGSGECITTGV